MRQFDYMEIHQKQCAEKLTPDLIFKNIEKILLSPLTNDFRCVIILLPLVQGELCPDIKTAARKAEMQPRRSESE